MKHVTQRALWILSFIAGAYCLAAPVGPLFQHDTLTPADSRKENANNEALRQGINEVDTSQIKNHTILNEDMSSTFKTTAAMTGDDSVGPDALQASVWGRGLRRNPDGVCGQINSGDIITVPGGVFEIDEALPPYALRLAAGAAGAGLKGGGGGPGEQKPLDVNVDDITLKIGTIPTPSPDGTSTNKVYIASLPKDSVTTETIKDFNVPARKLADQVAGNGLKYVGGGDTRKIQVSANASQFDFEPDPVATPGATAGELRMKAGGITAGSIAKNSIYGHEHPTYDHIAQETITGWNIKDASLYLADLATEVKSLLMPSNWKTGAPQCLAVAAMDGTIWNASGSGYYPVTGLSGISGWITIPLSGITLGANPSTPTTKLLLQTNAQVSSGSGTFAVQVAPSMTRVAFPPYHHNTVGDYSALGGSPRLSNLAAAQGVVVVEVDTANPQIRARYYCSSPSLVLWVDWTMLMRFNEEPVIP